MRVSGSGLHNTPRMAHDRIRPRCVRQAVLVVSRLWDATAQETKAGYNAAKVELSSCVLNQAVSSLENGGGGGAWV